MVINILLNSLSTPSNFAKDTLWAEEQVGLDYPILCHRPPEAYGLPLCTLHDAFRCFMVDLSTPLPNDLESSTSCVVAYKRCALMGDKYENEAERSQKFDECVHSLFSEFEKKVGHPVKPLGELHSGLVDRIYYTAQHPVLLREDKLEPGQAGDVYMQAARRYDLLSKKIRSSTVSKIKSHGVPVFMLCVEGTFDLYGCA